MAHTPRAHARTPRRAGTSRHARPRSSRPHERLGRLARPVLAPALAVVMVAGLLAGSASQAPRADAASGSPAAGAIRYALNQLGDPYVWGATGPGSFDCSGLTRAAYRAAGISLPRVSRDQYRSGGAKIGRPGWKPGDLVFWGSPVHHVGIYLGKNRVLHAPRPGRVVSIEKIWSYGLRYYAVRPARSAPELLNVRPGMNGDRVVVVQKRLRANGYSVSTTGSYDTSTERAVKRLQTNLGWRAYGSVGPGTWGYLVSHGQRYRPS